MLVCLSVFESVRVELSQTKVRRVLSVIQQHHAFCMKGINSLSSFIRGYW